MQHTDIKISVECDRERYEIEVRRWLTTPSDLCQVPMSDLFRYQHGWYQPESDAYLVGGCVMNNFDILCWGRFCPPWHRYWGVNASRGPVEVHNWCEVKSGNSLICSQSRFSDVKLWLISPLHRPKEVENFTLEIVNFLGRLAREIGQFLGKVKNTRPPL